MATPAVDHTELVIITLMSLVNLSAVTVECFVSILTLYITCTV